MFYFSVMMFLKLIVVFRKRLYLTIDCMCFMTLQPQVKQVKWITGKSCKIELQSLHDSVIWKQSKEMNVGIKPIRFALAFEAILTSGFWLQRFTHIKTIRQQTCFPTQTCSLKYKINMASVSDPTYLLSLSHICIYHAT